jgi:osmotically-inducible protein OsmY
MTAAGCAVSRGQQSAGAYVDDTVITSSVKTRMLDDERVAGTSITVETLNGTVMLSGLREEPAEKDAPRASRARWTASGPSRMKSLSAGSLRLDRAE